MSKKILIIGEGCIDIKHSIMHQLGIDLADVMVVDLNTSEGKSELECMKGAQDKLEKHLDVKPPDIGPLNIELKTLSLDPPTYHHFIQQTPLQSLQSRHRKYNGKRR